MDEQKLKFSEDDIIACPDWDRLLSVRPESTIVFKIRGIEHYGGITQYRVVQWNYIQKDWVVPWSEADFFQAGSRMEEYMESVNKLHVLVKHGIG